MSTRASIEDYPPGEYGLPHMGAVIADHRVKQAGPHRKLLLLYVGLISKLLLIGKIKGIWPK